MNGFLKTIQCKLQLHAEFPKNQFTRLQKIIGINQICEKCYIETQAVWQSRHTYSTRLQGKRRKRWHSNTRQEGGFNGYLGNEACIKLDYCASHIFLGPSSLRRDVCQFPWRWAKTIITRRSDSPATHPSLSAVSFYGITNSYQKSKRLIKPRCGCCGSPSLQ